MANINLSAAVRSNLSSLQNTASLMTKTSDRLSSGNKVNSALDNPTNFFTASSLNSRAGDLNNLMDSMANGIKTIEAANNGLTSITKNLESMQSTLRQARQDKSFQTTSLEVPKTGTPPTGAQLTFGKGAFGETATSPVSLTKTVTTGGTTTGTNAPATLTAGAFTDVDVSGASDAISFTLSINGTDKAISIDKAAVDAYNLANSTTLDEGALAAADVAALINAQAGSAVADGSSGAIKFTSTGVGAASTLEITGFTETVSGGDTGIANAAEVEGTVPTTSGGTTATTWKSVDELVSEINAKTVTGGADNPLAGKIRASNDNGKLRIENLSTQKLEITGASGGTVTGTAVSTSEITGNSVRADLADQFNELRDQLDKLSDDASFNGINLLRGDKLKITFNETGSSSIDIQSKGEESVNAANLKLSTTLTAKDLDSDTGIDTFLDQVKGALNKVRSQSSAFGSNLSIVQNRQDFTKSMINTLETGAGNLTLADMNQEAANMMALQTRQSLASSTLSMANQADQGVLQLLR